MICFFYFAYMIIVPYCYIRIFIFRRNHVRPGDGKVHQEKVEQRKRRNHVTFTCNMIVWLIQATCSLLVSINIGEEN